ncbi:hypothetical protein K8R43_05370 [archaeon]|nr:hypothetical protein [archaeon]
MRGIAPVVSVVLLISLAVISAMGVYWFISGWVSAPQTPETFSKISAEMVTPCQTTGNSTVIITNTSPPGKTVQANSLDTDWSYGIAANSSSGSGTCPPITLLSGEVASCVIINFTAGDGTITLYGTRINPQPVAC